MAATGGRYNDFAFQRRPKQPREHGSGCHNRRQPYNLCGATAGAKQGFSANKAVRCKRLLCSPLRARMPLMTRSLDSVVKTLASLPAEEQDRIAQWLSAELASEKRWTDMFDQSQDLLAQMADEAVADLEAGRTTKLDPEKL